MTTPDMNDKQEPVAKLHKALSVCGISCMEESDEAMAARFDRHLNALLNHIINRTSPPNTASLVKAAEVAALTKAVEVCENLLKELEHPNTGLDMAYENGVKHSIKAIQSLITDDVKGALRDMLMKVANEVWKQDVMLADIEAIVDSVMDCK